MKFDIEGKVVSVFDVREISERFSKREFVLETEDGRYSQVLLFESSGRGMEDLKDVKAGDEVRVHFNIRGREWTSPKGETKYFNSLHAWKVERFGSQKAAPGKPAASASANAGGTEEPPSIDDGDIPFGTCDIAYEPSPIANVLRSRL